MVVVVVVVVVRMQYTNQAVQGQCKVFIQQHLPTPAFCNSHMHVHTDQ